MSNAGLTQAKAVWSRPAMLYTITIQAYGRTEKVEYLDHGNGHRRHENQAAIDGERMLEILDEMQAAATATPVTDD